eukprot:jgi/Galph1/2422/GphlegSOOS_G1107.1
MPFEYLYLPKISLWGFTKRLIQYGILPCLLFYKVVQQISPLLPPSCRFIPTCSEYAIQAFQVYGLQKGLILTCWRILRCNPLGGYGYDPPQWPPPVLWKR